MKLYQGTAAGKTVVNVKGASPVTDVQLDLDKVQVNPLFKDLAGKDFLEGTTQAQIALSMTGDDPARIKQTLNGKGSLDFRTAPSSVWIWPAWYATSRPACAGEVQSGPKPRTDFSELAVPFTLQNGVFHTSETAMKSPLLRLLAAGKADLVKETLDFRVDPKLVGTIKGQGDEKDRSGSGSADHRVGQLRQPSFRPDVEGHGQGPAQESPRPVGHRRRQR